MRVIYYKKIKIIVTVENSSIWALTSNYKDKFYEPRKNYFKNIYYVFIYCQNQDSAYNYIFFFLQ